MDISCSKKIHPFHYLRKDNLFNSVDDNIAIGVSNGVKVRCDCILPGFMTPSVHSGFECWTSPSRLTHFQDGSTKTGQSSLMELCISPYSFAHMEVLIRT